MRGEVTAWIGLGSNLGERRATLHAAARALGEEGGVRLAAMSTIIETTPRLPAGAKGQGMYLNAVIRVETALAPRPLLAACQAVEARHGRDRRREGRFGPRPLDLDLLLYGDAVIDEPGLVVPHPRLHERWFVLQPLAELAGDLVHPLLGRSIESLRRGLEDRAGSDR